MRSNRPALFVLLAVALTAAGCSAFHGRAKTTGAVASAEGASSTNPDQIDPRHYLGPNYCPELRILNGAQLVRRYERGHDGDPAYVVWQASFGDAARECLYDGQGGLTLKIGVSGRVIAGPKGGPGDVSVPFKLAVVKFKEAVLASEGYTLALTIPPTGSTTFAEVRQVAVPSPGNDRDYIIYVGFDIDGWDPMNPAAVATAPIEQPTTAAIDLPPLEEEPKPAQPAPPPPKKDPSVLPTPTGGFVLSQ